MNEKILLVDDDRNILDAYKRHLRHKFDVATAESGDEGLLLLKEQGPFAVIVSDFRMPNMDGVQFLSQARQIAPDTVRVMLTGQADLQVTVDAVNEGNLFRFLLKPCPTDLFIKILNDAVEQYKLITAEQELLEKTLKGSIKILIDILSILSPVAFSQTPRIRVFAKRLAIRLGINDLWEIELASMLSQIGCVTMPNEILEKKYRGEVLSSAEKEIFFAHPGIGKKILSNIPRLEGIAEAVNFQEKHFDGGGAPKERRSGVSIPISARILKVVLDFNILIRSGKSRSQAIDEMYKNSKRYDPNILAALDAELLSVKEGYTVKAVSLKEITEGMVSADDIKDINGNVLITKEHEITDILKIRLLNYTRFGTIVEPIKILVGSVKDKN